METSLVLEIAINMHVVPREYVHKHFCGTELLPITRVKASFYHHSKFVYRDSFGPAHGVMERASKTHMQVLYIIYPD